MNHFYITLPSDNSVNYYPDNTVAHFTSRLPHRIRLDGDYEVGLSEIIYPYSWFNFTNGDEEVFTYFLKGETRSVKSIFESGQFAAESILVKSLNDKIADLVVSETNRKDLRAVFRFDDVLRKMRVTVSCREDEAFYMSDRFKNLFGFGNVGPYPDGTYTADNTFNVNDGSHLMYVYCDIASFTPVGHVKAPLLRVCSVSGKYGDTVRTIFTHPHYVPVARREIETVEININNELGKPMPFVFGKSVVTLHFKRRHSLLPSS
jgi:hypothetical protein